MCRRTVTEPNNILYSITVTVEDRVTPWLCSGRWHSVIEQRPSLNNIFYSITVTVHNTFMYSVAVWRAIIMCSTVPNNILYSITVTAEDRVTLWRAMTMCSRPAAELFSPVDSRPICKRVGRLLLYLERRYYRLPNPHEVLRGSRWDRKSNPSDIR